MNGMVVPIYIHKKLGHDDRCVRGAIFDNLLDFGSQCNRTRIVTNSELKNLCHKKVVDHVPTVRVFEYPNA